MIGNLCSIFIVAAEGQSSTIDMQLIGIVIKKLYCAYRLSSQVLCMFTLYIYVIIIKFVICLFLSASNYSVC